jgi:hypothetical protein
MLVFGASLITAFGPLGPRTGTRSLDFEFEAELPRFAVTAWFSIPPYGV